MYKELIEILEKYGYKYIGREGALGRDIFEKGDSYIHITEIIIKNK